MLFTLRAAVALTYRGWSKEVGAFVMVDLDGGSEEWHAATMHYCSDAEFGRVKVYA